MERKFKKKAGPFGTPPPGTPPGGPPAPAGGPPTGPRTAPTGPGGGTVPTPPHPPGGLTNPSLGPSGIPGVHTPDTEEGLLPRTPHTPESNMKTDVHVDAASGEVRIEKPGVTIHVASNIKKFPEGEMCSRCDGKGVSIEGDCRECGGTGVAKNAGDMDPWNYTHAPRNYLEAGLKVSKYSKDNPPDRIKHLPEHAQHIWIEAFNNAFDEYDDEERAFATAWAAVKKFGYKTKKDSRKFKKAEGNLISSEEMDKIAQNAEWKSSSGEGIFRLGLNGDRVDFRQIETPEGTFYERLDDHRTYGNDFEGHHVQSAVNPAWIEFKHNDNEPQYGDWREPELARETHEDPYASPKNRLVPPLYTIRANIPEYMNERSIAYVLQTSTMLDVTLNGNTMTIEGVASPISMITELKEYGIDAETVGGDPDKDTNTDYKPGQKVAMVGDYLDMNYYYNPYTPPVTATLVGKTDKGYILENDMWGRFEATKEEINHVQ